MNYLVKIRKNIENTWGWVEKLDELPQLVESYLSKILSWKLQLLQDSSLRLPSDSLPVGIPFHHLPYYVEFHHAPFQDFLPETATDYHRTG
jgi:hypothetical protein